MLAPAQDPATRASGFGADPAFAAALIIAVAGALTIAGAWFFELVIRLKPCPMCLEQRWPYYIGVPLALAVVTASGKVPRVAVVAALAVLAALMLWGAYLGAFHAGVEWKWWPGPTECSGAATLGPAGGLLDRLKDIIVVRCDEAAWRFLGISLAGYNALISLALAAVAAWGAKAAYSAR